MEKVDASETNKTNKTNLAYKTETACKHQTYYSIFIDYLLIQPFLSSLYFSGLFIIAPPKQAHFLSSERYTV